MEDIEKLKKTKELALFLGMFAGDGCLTENHDGHGYRIYPIRFYNTNKKYVELFGDLFFKLFGIKGTVRGRKREGKQVLFEFEKYSVKIYRIINHDFEIASGKKALKVKIPSFILDGDSEIMKHFFLGLLITDGGIRKDKTIIFHSASKELINDMKTLVFNVWKIDRKVAEYTQREKFRSYQLTLNKEDSSRILKQLPRWDNLVLR